jgi:uncharacterized protein
MTETDNTEVVNDTERHRLVLARDGHEGELIYERRSNQLILVHTEVPKELEGKRVGSLLVKAAGTWAEKDALVIVPWCPYARRWLQQHEDVASRVEIDWDTPRELFRSENGGKTGHT